LSDPILETVERYYSGKFAEHGPTPGGVDWNSAESQELRFEQLLRVREGHDGSYGLNDFGCGYAGLVPYLERTEPPVSYCGLDLSAEMLEYARSTFGDRPWVRFVDRVEDLQAADYTVASGVFNVKLDVDDETWRRYVLSTLDRIAEVSTRGFAFNMLTSYSDTERMRDALYYGDPGAFFDHCMRQYSRHVALRHDYGLYEFTILARLA
jgi:SAM-dependent methyltransferase